MLGHVGEIFDGVISSVTPFGLFVELANTCEGLIPISSLDGYFNYDERQMTLSCGYTVYTLGMRVSVQIESADIISRRVEMRIMPGENKTSDIIIKERKKENAYSVSSPKNAVKTQHKTRTSSKISTRKDKHT
jgi:ribonuclease R